MLEELVQRIGKTMALVGGPFEIILVDDASPDGSWSVITAICQVDEHVKGIKLSRNFGQHYAITAGLAEAKGEWVVVMDCDLQDMPEEIQRLHQRALDGYDIVLGQRENRRDGALKTLSSRAFYAVFGYLTDSEQDFRVANFGIYQIRVIRAILSMGDHIRFFPTMSQWVGFSKTKISVQHAERGEGDSSYSWKKLLALAYNNAIAFSDKPLRLTVRLGLLISIGSIAMAGYFLFKYLHGEIKVLGYASLIVSIWFLSGLIIFILGILGLYLGKVFEKVKDRPTYIVDRRLNC